MAGIIMTKKAKRFYKSNLFEKYGLCSEQKVCVELYVEINIWNKPFCFSKNKKYIFSGQFRKRKSFHN